MSDDKKTAEFWMQQDYFSNRTLIRDGGEKWPDDVNGGPDPSWLKCVEHAAYQKAVEENRELKSAAEDLAEALENWINWENEQIEKEGPYCGKAINALITDAKQALAKYRGTE